MNTRVSVPALIKGRVLSATLIILLFSGTPRADDFTKIAKAVSSPLSSQFEDIERAYSDDQVMLRLELARQRLQFGTTVESDMAGPTQRIRQHLESCRSTLDDMHRLDSSLPDIEQLAKRVIRASPAILRKDPETRELLDADKRAVDELTSSLVNEGFKSLANAWKLSEKREQYRESYRRARKASLALADAAKERCIGVAPLGYGIGVAVTQTDDALIVEDVIADGPAAKAGLKKGDQIMEINGKSVKPGESEGPVNERRAVLELRGEKGTTVDLVYSRDGTQKNDKLRRDYSFRLPLFEMDFDTSWNATFAQDGLSLKNISGTNLSNCTIRVSLIGIHGQSQTRVREQHLHFVDWWPADKTRYARYRSSSADGVASDESLDRVQQVVIEVYSDQYCDTISHDYEGSPEYREDISRFVRLIEQHQKFSFSFIADSVVSDAGVSVRHDGDFTFIPMPELTVTFTRGNDVRRMTWKPTESRWNSGVLSGLILQHPSFNGMKPVRVDLDLKFPETSETVSLTLKPSGT